jgi:hypothetical protein
MFFVTPIRRHQPIAQVSAAIRNRERASQSHDIARARTRARLNRPNAAELFSPQHEIPSNFRPAELVGLGRWEQG